MYLVEHQKATINQHAGVAEVDLEEALAKVRMYVGASNGAGGEL